MNFFEEMDNNTEKISLGNNINKIYKEKNTIVVIFKVISILTILGGFITGIELGSKWNGVQWGTTIPIWIGSFISALITYSFGEIIQILHDIRRKVYHIENKKKK